MVIVSFFKTVRSVDILHHFTLEARAMFSFFFNKTRMFIQTSSSGRPASAPPSDGHYHAKKSRFTTGTIIVPEILTGDLSRL